MECKGGSHQLRASKWILTSNYHPSTWYPAAGTHHQEALVRRFSRIIHCTCVKEEFEPVSFADVVIDISELSDDE